jgi:choline dehydrogenase-like flavoprotein
MPLSEKQRANLKAIVDTFAPAHELPGGERTPAASDLGVVELVEKAVDMAPRKADQKQTATLFGLFGSPALTALGGGGLKRFPGLGQAEREAVLRSWADSKVPQRRAVFQALRKASVGMAYMAPDNPLWEHIGFPGPRRDPAPAAPLSRIEPVPVTGDLKLDCDVVVVGSGAGGGVAAAVLAQAGLDVIVVEAGGYHAEDEFDGSELKAVENLYLNGGGIATHDQSVGLIAGATLGGGTVVNYTTSFRTPDGVRAEWASHGVDAFTGDDYSAALDGVCERIGVSSEESTPSARDALMHRGLTELGWHSDFMPRNTRGCKQDERCGYCGYGCPYGAKQSGLVTWLQDHREAGGRVLVDTHVERIVVAGGAARGVEGVHHPTGSKVTIHARAVVCAAGALHTPALLKRSGMKNPNIGKNLRLHPATAIWGVFDEEVRGWGGTLQAVYSDQFADLDGEGYGLKFETAPTQPLLLFSFAPWRSAAQHFELMQSLPHTGVVGVLLRDKGAGEVRVGRDGAPVARYALSPTDVRHLRVGVEGAAKVLKAAGATRIYTSHSKLVETRNGDLDALMSDADACGYGAGQIVLGSFHIMGTARMGGHPTTAACDPTGQTYDVRDVVVCDGSTFPTSSGVNPQISIMAIAMMNARALAARLA